MGCGGQAEECEEALQGVGLESWGGAGGGV